MGSLFNNRFTRPLFNPGMRLALRRRPTRQLVNSLYNRLPFEACAGFYNSFSTAYYGVEAPSFEEDIWIAKFDDVTVKVMLTPNRLWERWGIALGIRGHDAPIKETYANILGSTQRPDLFVDVGANYGTHSLIFARSNVPVVAFEPNPECAGFARELQALNGVTVPWHQVAIGDVRSEVVLTYPVDGHWLGQVAAPGLSAPRDGMRRVSVEQHRLDDYEFAGGRMLIKIDVEGRECEVLRGAEATLAARRPIIVFESYRELADREPLWSIFDRAGYTIACLPWHPDAPGPGLDRSSFVAAGDSDFIAVPVGGR